MAERGVMGFSASSRLVQQRFSSRLVVLGMGKGLGRSRNKQQELARKMALAKKQNQGQGGSKEKLSAKEIKERNDRLRFEQLLKTQSASVGGISDDEYLTPQQEEKELTARCMLSKILVEEFDKGLLCDSLHVASVFLLLCIRSWRGSVV